MNIVNAPMLLRAFLDKHGLSQAEAARQLKVTPVAIHEWLTGHQRPRIHHRRSIERWTGGTVPLAAWDTEAERKAVKNVEPFVPEKKNGTEG